MLCSGEVKVYLYTRMKEKKNLRNITNSYGEALPGWRFKHLRLDDQ